MTNTFKLICAAALVATSATATFAGNPEAVLNNQVEEPVIVETGEDWRLVAGVAGLGLLVACAIACGSDGDGSSSTTTTTTGN